MANAEKVAAVAELTERFRGSSGAVLTEYRGLSVAQLAELRKALGDDATFAVVKNTLTKIADGLAVARIAGRRDLNAPRPGELRDAAEPEVLAGRVFVRDHQGHLDALPEQDFEAAATDVVVREYDGAGHSFFSSIAWTT